MMLYKLSLRNIQRSIRDYGIYFFTLIIGVAVFYAFNAISGQAAMMTIGESTHSIIQLLKGIISAISVVVAIILGLLIVYANIFLMKRRNKEFALYMVLGMSKGEISTILVFETIFAGIISLVVGITIGIGMSQLMSALVASLFETDMTAYRFMISNEAILQTIVYFSAMYIIVAIFNGTSVSKMKLIDLIQSGRKAEKVVMKNPIICSLVFIIACVALGYAYWLVTYDFINISPRSLFTAIGLGIVSTFLIFWSVSGMMLRVLMLNKNLYFRGLNVFTFRQVSSKVNTIVASMSVICLMLFVTICSLAASFSIRNSLNMNLQRQCPSDVEITTSYHGSGEFTSIESLYETYGISLTDNLSDYRVVNTYTDDSFLVENHMGEQGSMFNYSMSESIVGISDYNNLMELYGKEPLVLGDDEYIVVADFINARSLRDEVLTKGKEETIFGHILKAKEDHCVDGFIQLAAQKLNFGIYVVPDYVVEGQNVSMEYFIANYDATTKEEKLDVESVVRNRYEALMKAISADEGGIFVGLNTRFDIAESSIGLGAIATFLGLYIGLVLLIACGAILALKALSESVDSMPRYEILRKIGVGEKELNRSLWVQTGIFFLLPLILACIHSIYGMRFSMIILMAIGTEMLFESIAITVLIVILIYGGYFLITYFNSKNIIRNKVM